METLDCIMKRASVRSFRADPVPEEKLQKILEAAVNAPSAGNVQDWKFIVVKKSEMRKALSEAALGQSFVAEAPVVIVVCSDLKRISAAYGSRGKDLYSIQDAAAATQNMLLAACDLGLGTCWVGAFDEDMVKALLGIPEGVRPLALVPIGYPALLPRKPKRQDLKKFVHQDGF